MPQRIVFNLRGGKLVDPSPEIVSERQSELEKLNVQYGGDKGVDMTQFPQFKFDGMQFFYLYIYQTDICKCLYIEKLLQKLYIFT